MIDEYGEGLYPDLLFYYGVDLAEVVSGRGPSPALVTLLVQRLPDTSLTIALASGGRDHFGWGTDRHLAAETYDAINQNTRATGNWAKGKVPEFPSWPRPSTKRKEEKNNKARSVRDIFNSLTSRR